MRSLPRTGPSGPPPTTSRRAAGSVSPAALRLAQEADATMTPDGWRADYAAPGWVAGPARALPGPDADLTPLNPTANLPKP